MMLPIDFHALQHPQQSRLSKIAAGTQDEAHGSPAAISIVKDRCRTASRPCPTSSPCPQQSRLSKIAAGLGVSPGRVSQVIPQQSRLSKIAAGKRGRPPGAKNKPNPQQSRLSKIAAGAPTQGVAIPALKARSASGALRQAVGPYSRSVLWRPKGFRASEFERVREIRHHLSARIVCLALRPCTL